MGLDMYLNKKVYIGGKYEQRRVTGQADMVIDGVPLCIPASRITEITEEAGYWRKANAIHGWFVDNVQDGEDDCQSYSVSTDQLKALREECIAAQAGRDTTLEPRKGFFFGSYEKDECYQQDLKDTIEIVDRILAEQDAYPESAYVDYEYRAS